MRAAVYRSTGSARDVLRVEDVEQPEPGPGEVLVRVRASGVNPTDFKTRAGATARPIDEFQIPHQDGAGVIEAVGPGVDEARVGERVWLWLAAHRRRWGTAAEWTAIPSRQAVRLPDGASFELGASLGVPAMTAHRCLFADGPVAGKTVLVAGGAGAVGHFAIELAKHAGARVVSTVSGPEKGALAAKAGADLVVNYRDTDAADQVRAFAPVVDRVVEVALGANLPLDLAVAGPPTVVVSYAADGPDPVLPVRACMTANVTLRFVLLYGVPAPALDAAVADITGALAADALTELPVRRYPLSEVVAAHEAAEGGALGKVIVVPLPSPQDADAEPVLPAGATALAAAAVCVGVHAAEVPAASVAYPAFGERVDSQRDVIPDCGDDADDDESGHVRIAPAEGATDARDRRSRPDEMLPALPGGTRRPPCRVAGARPRGSAAAWPLPGSAAPAILIAGEYEEIVDDRNFLCARII